MASDTRERVLRLVGEMAPLRDAEVGLESQLRDDLGYDSLSLLELAAALEDEFKLPPAAELDAEEVETVAEVERAVLEKLEAAGADALG